MKLPSIVAVLLLAILAAVSAEPPALKLPRVSTAYRVPGPEEGYVPDKETAIKIAEVVLFRLYCEKNITVQRPYVVTEDDVRGGNAAGRFRRLPCRWEKKKSIPRIVAGSTIESDRL